MHRNYLRGKSNRIASTSYLVFLIFVGIFQVVSLGGLLFQVIPGWLDSEALDRDGVVTGGRVVDLDYDYDEEYTYYVSYQFQVGNTDDYRTHKQIVNGSTYNGYEVGRAVEVRYLPDDPSVAALLGDNAASQNQRKRGNVAIAFALGTSLVNFFVFRARQKQIRLKKKGQMLRAEVLSAESHEDSDYDLNVKVKCRFVTPSGQEIIKEQKEIANSLKGKLLPKYGEPVAVVYVNEKNFKLL